ncbi:MAG: hypothetical protein ACSW77_07420, partial [Bacteroidales bacterium]
VMQKFIPHYAELERVQSEIPDIKVLRGMEVDFFESPEWRRGFEQCVARLKPDYIIGSCHLLEYKNEILNSHDWKKADTSVRDVLLKLYRDEYRISYISTYRCPPTETACGGIAS